MNAPKLVLIVICIFLLGNSSKAQSSILEALSADYSSSGVILSWTIRAGNTCNGVSIYRSSDSLNFVQIGQIDGVCGSNEESVSYTFIDSSPLNNALNYYRIDLGGFGLSEIVKTLYYEIASDGYLIFPNPALASNTLVFQNPANRKMNIQVFDIFGSLVFTTETNQKSLTIPTANFPMGLYYFKLIDEDQSKIINGKFEVG